METNFRAAYKAGKRSVEEHNHGRSERLEIVASAVVLFVGSYWGFKLVPLSLKNLIANHNLWLWWVIGELYFTFALSLITAFIFVSARHYTEFAPTAATKRSCLACNLLSATLMVSAASTQESAVQSSLASIGFEYLSWLLLGTAFVVFLQMGSVIVTQPE
jgi:hypothetical protein